MTGLGKIFIVALLSLAGCQQGAESSREGLLADASPPASVPRTASVGPTSPAVANRDSEPPQKRITLTNIPEVSLTSHRGEQLRFRADLLEGNLIAMNFIFTNCGTICPPQGALFAQMQAQAKTRGLNNIKFISVSIDPVTDTPERLSVWAKKFGESPDWTLVTGEQSAITSLLESLGVYSAVREDHAPVMLLGNESTGEWRRAYGLAAPGKLLDTLEELSKQVEKIPSKLEPTTSLGGPMNPGKAAAREYFTNIALVDQKGKEHRFYDELIAEHTVVIHVFFAHCEAACPQILGAAAKIQSAFRSRMGEELHILSVTLDPENDSPERLARLAGELNALPGWHFLTGKRGDVKSILTKLGQWTEKKESHKSVFLVGNDRTGLWKKVFALGPSDEVLQLVRTVVEDGH